jgi:glycosyltransferase involved in cell wall biosynthesis
MITTSPKVSICIPSYCEPTFLEAAINSCLVQNYGNFEIIISDDTPSDSVKKVVASYSAEDNRIRYFRNPSPHGAAANSNFAARHATGEWVKFLYHDDAFLDEESLALFVSNIDKADVLFSSCAWVKADCRGIYRIGEGIYAELKRDPVATLIRRGNVIGAPSSIMVRRNRLLPFDESMCWLFDVFCYIQMALQGMSFYCLDRPVILINQHKNQLTEKVHDDPVINLREGLTIARCLISQGTHKFHILRYIFRLAFIVGRRLEYADYTNILRQTRFQSLSLCFTWFAGKIAQKIATRSLFFKIIVNKMMSNICS